MGMLTMPMFVLLFVLMLGGIWYAVKDEELPRNR